jgi:hypothetical protein
VHPENVPGYPVHPENVPGYPVHPFNNHLVMRHIFFEYKSIVLKAVCESLKKYLT